jgi:phosphatidylglycerol:prolipoprotein diacylglycerol transferase
MSALPYWTAPSTTVELPLLGPTTIGVFGPMVILGILIGLRACRRYARERGLDSHVVDDAAWWALCFGFVGAHLVAVLAYHPERALAEPWILLFVWSGIASTGGFLGALVGLVAWSRRRGRPLLPIADAIAFGLVPGFTISRFGCALVHDHVGIATNASWIALGPWPCACGVAHWRYDLGLVEALLLVVVWVAVHRFYAWRTAPTGQLVGGVALVYGCLRFPLDFLRTADALHFGLTFAQWACLGFVAMGAWLLVSTKRG